MQTERINILLVDDQPANLIALKGILNNPSYNLITVSNGFDALNTVLETELALILLDVAMPGMSGFEVAESLQGVRRTQHIPIVFLTAVAEDVEQVYHAYAVGAVDYLVKPLNADIVRHKVAVFVDLYRQQRHIKIQSELLQKAQEREYEQKLIQQRYASDRRYQKLLDGIEDAIGWSARADDLQMTFVSKQAQEVLGLEPRAFFHSDFWHQHLHADDKTTFFATVERARDLNASCSIDHRLRDAQGAYRWFHTSLHLEQEDADPIGILHGLSTDVTEIKNKEERQRFLADASARFSESRNYDAIFDEAAKIFVPQLADSCILEALTDDDVLQLKVVLHAHDDVDARLKRWCALNQGAYRVLDARQIQHQSKSSTHEIIDDLDLHAAFADYPAQLSDCLSEQHAVMLPLRARGRLLGTMTLGRSLQKPSFTGNEKVLLQEVAWRAALALDNGRLYELERRLTRNREELLAIVSHDLRNPLSCIVTHAESLQRKIEPEGQGQRVHRAVDVMLRASNQMERLIADLLDYACIDAGGLVVQRQLNEVKHLLDDTLSMLAPVASHKKQQLHYQQKTDIQIFCDHERILQVLGNLVSNACRFTPEQGRIDIIVQKKNDEAMFTVQDTGPGVLQEEVQYVFERGWQSSKRMQGGGSGLGLTIAKALVEAHGGKIWAESRPNTGGLFHFTLPLKSIETTTQRH